jgi:hypothetical protein
MSMMAPVQATTPGPYFVVQGTLVGGQSQPVLVTAKPSGQTPTTPEVVYQLGQDKSALQQAPVQLNYCFVNNNVGK